LEKGTVHALLGIAKKEIGYVEQSVPENKTKYQKTPQPWCGAFVNWVAKKAGVEIPNCVYTPAGAKAFQDKKQWVPNSPKANPQAGDIVFFDFPNDGIERISHCGIVVKDNGDGTITTIEGNTTHDRKGDQRNGGEVCLKVRAYKKKNSKKLGVAVVGYGRPKYAKSTLATSHKEACPTCGRSF